MSEVAEWLQEHGLSISDLNDWGAYVDKLNNRIIVPVKGLDGNFCFDVIRNFNPNLIKYEMRPKNCRVSYMMYGLTNEMLKADFIVLVEGFSDVIALRKWGVPAVATFSSHISPVQWAFVSPLPNIIAYGDGDEAGRKWVRELATKYDNVLGMVVDGLDPAEFVARVVSLGRIKEGGSMMNYVEQQRSRYRYIEFNGWGGIAPDGNHVRR